MKNFKKIMALVVAMVMVIATMNLGFAADGDGMDNAQMDSQIKITGLESTDTVNFYQILEWKGNDGTYGGWSLVAPFTGIVDSTNDALKDAKTAIATIIGDPAGNPAVDMALTSEIAGKLADLAADQYKKAGSAVANGESTLAIGGQSGNTLGLYMALITPNDANTVYNPVFVSADYNTSNGTDSQIATSDSTYSDSAAAKKGKVKIDKKAEKDAGTSYDQEWKSTRIGEIVHYTVDTVIPGYGEVYQNPFFKVTDKLSALELSKVNEEYGDVTLVAPAGLQIKDATHTDGTGATESEDDDYDYEITYVNDGSSYSVQFSTAYLKTVKKPTDVQITYSAVVTTEAPKSVNEESNEVWVEYSHDPTDENDHDFQKDDTNHYTFTIDANVLGGGSSAIGKSGSEIVKVGVDASGNPVTSTTSTYSWDSEATTWESPLADALFTLYKEDGTTVYTSVDGTEYKDIPSQADGRITLTGLDAGKYVLKETKAPNGFIKDLTPVNIEIKAYYDETKSITMYTKNGTDWVYAADIPAGEEDDYKACTYEAPVLTKYEVLVNGSTTTHTFYNDGGKELKWVEASSSEAPTSIVNTQGVELPSTGGMGTTLFYAIGAILVLGAGILLVSKRRMSAN